MAEYPTFQPPSASGGAPDLPVRNGEGVPMRSKDGRAVAEVGRRNTVMTGVQFSRSRSGSKSSSGRRRSSSRRSSSSAMADEFHAESERAKALDLSQQNWHRPDWTREMVERFLRGAKEGAFIMRRSRNSDKNMVLSVCLGDNEFKHILLAVITKSLVDWYNISPTRHWFSHLFDLVWYCHIKDFFFEGTSSLKAIRLSFDNTNEAAVDANNRRRLKLKAQQLRNEPTKFTTKSKKSKPNEKCAWFMPALSKEGAEEHLAVGQPGAFVVREDGVLQDGSTAFCVSFVSEKKDVRHVRFKSIANREGIPMFAVPPGNNYFERFDDLAAAAEKVAIIDEATETKLSIKAAEKVVDFHKKAATAKASQSDDKSDKKVKRSKKAALTQDAERFWLQTSKDFDAQDAEEILVDQAKGAFVIFEDGAKLSVQTGVNKNVQTVDIMTRQEGDTTWYRIPGNKAWFEDLFDMVAAGQGESVLIKGFEHEKISLNLKAAKKAADLAEAATKKQDEEKRQWQEQMMAGEKSGEAKYNFASDKAKGVDMTQEEWFRPWCSKDQAIAYLTGAPLGAFLVRESKSAPGSYALSVQGCQEEIQHVLLEKDSKLEQIWFNIAPSQNWFEHLYDLVVYGSVNPFSLGTSSTRLVLNLKAAKKADLLHRAAAKKLSSADELKARDAKERQERSEAMGRLKNQLKREEEAELKRAAEEAERAKQEALEKALEDARRQKEAREKAALEKERKAQESAAVKIQAGFRGMKARTEYRGLQEEAALAEAAAAEAEAAQLEAEAQAAEEAALLELEALEKEEQTHAATKIQASYRGMAARRAYQHKKAEREQAEEDRRKAEEERLQREEELRVAEAERQRRLQEEALRRLQEEEAKAAEAARQQEEAERRAAEKAELERRKQEESQERARAAEEQRLAKVAEAKEMEEQRRRSGLEEQALREASVKRAADEAAQRAAAALAEHMKNKEQLLNQKTALDARQQAELAAAEQAIRDASAQARNAASAHWAEQMRLANLARDFEAEDSVARAKHQTELRAKAPGTFELAKPLRKASDKSADIRRTPEMRRRTFKRLASGTFDSSST